jgi:hypothetical protein
MNFREILFPRCEYPGGWLRATPRSGLTPFHAGQKGALLVTRRPDALASPYGRPGPEQRRDLIGARLLGDPSQYRSSSPAPRVELTATSRGAF